MCLMLVVLFLVTQKVKLSNTSQLKIFAMIPMQFYSVNPCKPLVSNASLALDTGLQEVIIDFTKCDNIDPARTQELCIRARMLSQS